jgi:hypothetical protein
MVSSTPMAQRLPLNVRFIESWKMRFTGYVASMWREYTKLQLKIVSIGCHPEDLHVDKKIMINI